jgi:3-oxoacyl-[acyl-carrier-protein] synthase-1
MDNLCKAGFLASEILLNDIHFDRNRYHQDTAIVLFNSVSSLDDDIAYQKTIADKNNFYPSPAVFVYTLANIVTGEIAIRNKIQGETAFYIVEKYSENIMDECVSDIFEDKNINAVIGGWINVLDNILDVNFMYFLNK